MGRARSSRMLCTRCAHTASPDLRVAGSDLLELLLWCLFLVPGFLYCVWRHLQRSRVCPQCGSADLIRESTASRRRRSSGAPATPAEPGQLVYAARHIPWMSSPSARLRGLSGGGAVLGMGMAAWALVSVNLIEAEPEPAPSPVAVVEPRSEAEVVEERSRRIQSRRERECERLCTEFHGAKAKSHRDCMQQCLATLFDEGKTATNKEACADLMGSDACEFVSGGAAKPRRDGIPEG